MTYYELNKDRLLKQQKEYNEKNKDKINEKFGRIKCKYCQSYYKPNREDIHYRTKTHWKYINYPIFNDYKKI